MLGNRILTLGSPTGEIVNRDALVKPYIGVTGTADDALLDIMIEAAITQAETYCQRFFLQRSVTETMQGELSSRKLVLFHTPVGTLTSIADSDGTVIDSGDYILDTKAGIVSYVDSGTLFAGDYTAIYTAGYFAASMPASIKLAILELVKQAWGTKVRDGDAVIRQSPDIGSITFKGAVPGITDNYGGALKDLPSSVQRALAPYKRNWA